MSLDHPDESPQPRSAWLEDAVEAWRHQHRGCPGDAVLVAYCQRECSWPQRLALWWHVRRCALCRDDLATLHEAFAASATDATVSPPQALPRRAALAVGALAVGLCLSLALNGWLGMRLLRHSGSANRNGRIQLAFADNVREQELRTLLLTLHASIIRGPSQEGMYIVQVPLPSRLRSAEDPMRLLLQELRAHPAVRLAEPISPSE